MKICEVPEGIKIEKIDVCKAFMPPSPTYEE